MSYQIFLWILVVADHIWAHWVDDFSEMVLKMGVPYVLFYLKTSLYIQFLESRFCFVFFVISKYIFENNKKNKYFYFLLKFFFISVFSWSLSSPN